MIQDVLTRYTAYYTEAPSADMAMEANMPSASEIPMQQSPIRMPGWAVPWIDPYRGWVLQCRDVRGADGFYAPDYFVSNGSASHALNVSRFSFIPTQRRFEWLIDNTVLGSVTPLIGPWNDASIDAARFGW